MQHAIDPYEVLQLPKNYTLDQLKSQYKRLALQLHPDKNPLAGTMFQILTSSYKTLHREFVSRMSDKPHAELKQQAHAYAAHQTQAPRQNVHAGATPARGGSKFDLDKFNHVFGEMHLKDAYQDGYESWLRSEEAPRRSDNKHVIVYKEPEPLPASNKLGGSFYELGVQRVKDFSALNLSHHDLNFSDLRKAHTTDCLIDTERLPPRREYKSMEELKVDRANLPFEMDPAELQQLELERRKQEKREALRLRRLEEYDRRAEELHHRVNKLMLGS